MQVSQQVFECLVKQAQIIFGHPAVVEVNEAYLPEIKEHLVSLSSEDRNLRFYMVVNEAYIERYVDNQIKWETDKCFAIFHWDKIVAFLHLAIREKVGETAVNAEIGISVNNKFRGKGFGKKLMSRVLNYCISNGIEELHTECLRENRAMQALAKSIDMKVVISEDVAMAKRDIDTDDWVKRTVANHKERLYHNVSLVDRTAYKISKAYEVLGMVSPV